MKSVKFFIFSVLLGMLLPQFVIAEMSIKEAVELYFKVPLFSRLKLSPDGSHLSLIMHHDRQDVLASYNIATQKTRSIRGMAGQSIFTYDWLDKDHLIFNVQQWNVYYVSMYSVDESMKNPRAIGVQEISYTGSTYSEQILYLEDALPLKEGTALLRDYTKNETFADTVYYNRGRDSLTDRVRNKDHQVDWLCDINGVVRVIERLTAPGETEYLYRDSAKSEWVKVDLDPYSTIQAIDGRRGIAFVNYYSDEGNNVFQTFDLRKNELSGKQVKHDLFACAPSLLKDNRTGMVIGVRYQWDKPKVVYFDSDFRSAHKHLQTAFKGADIEILGITKVGSVIFTTRSDTIPLYVWELDPNKDPAIRLLLKKAGWIKPEHCQPMVPIHVETRDGKEVQGYLTRSKANLDKPGPTIMLLHGGPYARDHWGYNTEVQFLSALGYNVIQVNYRGSSGFNSDYSIRNLQDVCRYAVEDVADTARWAIAEGIADPKRLAIMGGSFGGYAALAGAAFEPDLYKVAIGFAGVYNYDRQLYLDYRDSPTSKEWLSPIIGEIEKNPNIYKELSPINYVDDIKAKILLLHGGADRVVAASQTKRMSKALKEAGKKHEVHITAWGVHGLHNQKEANKYGTRIGEFLRKNL